MAPDSEYARLATGVLPELQSMVATTMAVPKMRSWSLYLRGAAESDDNVPARATADPDESETDSLRMTCSAYVELRPVEQAVRQSPVTVGLGYSFYGTSHTEEDYEGYDVARHAGSAYISRDGYLGSTPYGIRIEGGLTETDLGDEPFSEAVSAEVILDLQWVRWATFSPRCAWTQKDFEHDTDAPEYYSRDGDEQTIGVGQRFYINGNAAILGLDCAYRIADTDGSQFDLESYDVTGSLTVRLPARLRFFGSVTFEDEDYVEFVPDPPRRLDEAWTYYAALSRPLLNDLFRIEINYTYAESESNQEFSAYERQVAGVALSLGL